MKQENKRLPEYKNITTNDIGSFLKAGILTNQTDINLNSNNLTTDVSTFFNGERLED
jgi:hypothetical protein